MISVGFVASIGRARFSDLLLRAGPRIEPAYQTGARAALLAAVAAGRLDLAVHPGAPPPNLRTTLLGEDAIVAALSANHPLARGGEIEAGALADQLVLLPTQGDDGDLRRLAQDRLPGLRRLGERPMAQLLLELAAGDAIALITAGQDEELGPALVTRPIAGGATRFPVHLTWVGPARPALAALIAALTALSPPGRSRLIPNGGGKDDGAGIGGGSGEGRTG